MICPNCSTEFASGNQCPKCKLDTVLFAGTVKISDTLYNKGLAKIKVNDLSGGIDYLTKSVEVNKNNLLARNLLGLALYEIGHIGEALKQWVISHSLIKENNPAAAYISEVQKNYQSLEQFNDSIRMYNQALEYIKQKSDDMAIIQLKKAVDINPKFVDALNLLTLCYLIQRDREKAAVMVERVLSVDAYNTMALNYYAELYPNRVKPAITARKAAPPPVAPSSPVYSKINLREKKSTNFHIAEILSFIIGAACMFAALYVLVIPAINRDNEARINELQTRKATEDASYRSQLEGKSTEISDLNNRILDLEASIEDWTQRYDTQERTNRVLNAYGMLTDNKYQEAADLIMDVDTEGLASDIIEKAESAKSISYAKLAQSNYESGVYAYDKEKDYDKARVDLEKAYRYMAEDASFRADLLYYLGSTYAKDEAAAEDAIAILTLLAEEYPNYKRIKDVNKLLTNLG